VATVTEPDAHARRIARSAFIGRLTGAHFLCYPLMFVGAAAGMSLAIVFQAGALMAAELTAEPETAFQRWLVGEVSLGPAEAAAFEVIMKPVAVALAVIFVLAHVAAVPWALAARRKALGEADAAAVRKARNTWIVASLGTTGVVVIAGIVGWAVILLT
jgi:hypothetical protein